MGTSKGLEKINYFTGIDPNHRRGCNSSMDPHPNDAIVRLEMLSRGLERCRARVELLNREFNQQLAYLESALHITWSDFSSETLKATASVGERLCRNFKVLHTARREVQVIEAATLTAYVTAATEQQTTTKTSNNNTAIANVAPANNK